MRIWPLPWIAKGTEAYRLRRLTDPQEIAGILLEDPTYTAYALGQLEAPLFARSEWWLAEGSAGWTLLMHSRGGVGNALLALGDNEVLAAALALHPGPLFTFVTGQPQHLGALRRFYYLRQEGPLLRLMVDAEGFSPAGRAIPLRGSPGPGGSGIEAGQCRRLGVEDLGRVNRLYGSDPEPYHLSSRHLREAVYYGVEAEGELLAIAGTHAVSPTYGIGVVGNVFTHVRHRGQGYATIATSAVTAELLESYRQVVLTVDGDNAPALRAYQRLGYRQVGQILETAASRRPSTVLSGPRRLLARLRGRPTRAGR